MDYYMNTDTMVETIHARQFRGPVSHAQMNLNPTILQTKYTYVSLELGPLVLCTDTQDGYMQTYWPHHVTLAYLAATEGRWQGDLIENMQEI